MAERLHSGPPAGQSDLPFLSLTPAPPRLPTRRREHARPPANDGDRCQLLTVEQVCGRLQCGRTYVYELLQQRRMGVVKLGRSTRIPLSELERFVATRVAEARDDGWPPWSHIGGREKA